MASILLAFYLVELAFVRVMCFSSGIGSSALTLFGNRDLFLSLNSYHAVNSLRLMKHTLYARLYVSFRFISLIDYRTVLTVTQ